MKLRKIARSGCIALLASASAFAGTGRERLNSERGWHDIEGRIQHYYFNEDSQALAGLQQHLAGRPATDRLGGYYDALIAYRLTLLTARANAEPDRGQLRDLLSRCVSRLEPVLAGQKDFAEGLALQGACLGMAAELDFWHAPIRSMRSSIQFRRALQLAPANPRVLLLQATADVGRDDDRAIEGLKKAISGFEAERKSAPHVPAWGGAEAYELMARIYLRRGQVLEARDALERSLLLAPGYVQARRLLLQITS